MKNSIYLLNIAKKRKKWFQILAINRMHNVQRGFMMIDLKSHFYPLDKLMRDVKTTRKLCRGTPP